MSDAVTTDPLEEEAHERALLLLDPRLDERGLSREDIRAADAKIVLKWPTMPGAGPVLVIEYRHADGSTVQRLVVLRKSKTQRNLVWEKGAKVKGAVMVLGDSISARVVVVAEGESDSLASWRHLKRLDNEVAVLCVPGAGMVGDDLANFIGNGAHVVIATDADQSGDRCAAQVRSVLLAASVDGALISRLRPAVPGVDEPDLRDLVEYLEGEVEDVAADLLGRLLSADGDRDHVVDHLHQGEDPDHDEAAAGQWSKPVPLAGGPRPAFPLIALPSIMRDQVAALAEAVQVPADLAAAVAFGVLSAATGDVSVEVRPGWLEPISVYVVAVAESGEGKGPTVRALVAPLEAVERERIEEARERVAIGQARFDTIEQRLKQARGAAAKADAGLVEEATRNDLAAELSRTRRPELPRMLADDATPEALVSLLARNGRVAVISDEGGLFDTLAGRYSNGVANVDAVLKAWGRDSIRVDRKGREAENVQRPVMTLCLAVQPIVVELLAANPLLRGRGLPARFLWFWPQTRLGRRRDDSALVPPAVTDAWDGLVRQLASMPVEPVQPAQLGPGGSSTGCTGSTGGVVLTIDARADDVFRAFRRANEDRLRPEDGDLYLANGWAGKLPGQVARIAGLLHLAEYGGAGVELPIGEETMRAAAAIGLYLVDHALAAFGLDGPGGVLAPDARRAVAWIVKSGRQEFSHQEAHDALRTKARGSSDEWRPVLDLLERLGYIRRRQLDVATPRAGRPASPVYEVNPLLLVGGVEL